MPRRVTLSDVAKRAGVSPAAASFVLSGRSGQGTTGSPATRSAVEQAASELGYTPNRYAQAMRTGKTGAIALALGDPRDPWAAEAAFRVNQQAEEHGLSAVLIVNDDWFPFLQGHQFDAVLVTGVDSTAHTRTYGPALARHGQHVVIYSEFSQTDECDVIASLASPAMGQAYRHLRTRHDRVHLLTAGAWMPSEPPLRTRDELFRDAVAAAGDDLAGLVLQVPRPIAEARAATVEHLARGPRPTAIIAQTGYLALAAQVAAMQLGIRVPDDLELIAIGDVPQSMSLVMPVSFYAATNVFDTISDTVVRRAQAGSSEPYTRIELPWTFHPGATTRDEI